MRWLIYRVSLALLGVALLGVLVVERANAYPQPTALADGTDYAGVCPPRPADSGSSDEQVVKLVELQQQGADACVRREEWERYEAGATGPTGPTGASGPVSSEQFDNATTALHGDLWIVAGILVGAAGFGMALRKLWP